MGNLNRRKSKVDMKQSFNLLKANKHILTKQQYRTLKGQILSGDITGFEKGLNTIKERRVKYGNDRFKPTGTRDN
jgi:hypothetical protein